MYASILPQIAPEFWRNCYGKCPSMFHPAPVYPDYGGGTFIDVLKFIGYMEVTETG